MSGGHGAAAGPPEGGANLAPRRDPKRPYHLGVAVGLTTGLYAATLLVTTRLQIETDRALIAERDPVQRAIDALGGHHASLTDLLDQAREQYNVAAAGFGSIIDGMDGLDERLASITRTVAAAEKISASISANLSLPTVPVSKSNGGSSGSGSGSGGGTAIKPPTIAPPPKAAPPPTSGSTGASGAP